MGVAFLQCESHAGRPLTAHLRDVASRLRLSAPTCSWLPWVGLFHDFGKATSFFQRYLHGDQISQKQRRHSDLGALWLLEYLIPKIANATELSIVEAALAFLFVRRHHGRLDDLGDAFEHLRQNEIDQFAEQLAAMDVAGGLQWLAAELGESACCPALDRTRTPLRVQLLLQLSMACDNDLGMARFQSALQSFGLLIEADRDSAAQYSVGAFDQPARFTSGHVTRFRQSLPATTAAPSLSAARELVSQVALSNAVRYPTDRGRLWTLTVPTGAGKTLAALGWALKRREFRLQAGIRNCSIIYALPFTSIIDQNADVMRRLGPEPRDDEAVLAVHHHLADFGDIARSGEDSLARSWIEGWRSDVVITTFVQVANALFHGTCADSRRFARLAGGILILDEVQSIPAELWPVFRTALQSLSDQFGTDTLLVTATQPALFSSSETVEIGPAEFPENTTEAFDRYDVRIESAKPLGGGALVQMMTAELIRGHAKSCLTILNTVHEALELHRLVASEPKLREHRLFHLSTNLRPKDRNRILTEVAQCACPRILVATQVVEAGIDLSFDLVIRALAPLDAIVQAAGRCNRHGTGVRGQVIVVVPEGNSAIAVYGSLHISLARQMLTELVPSMPGDRMTEPAMARVVSAYFAKLKQRIQRDTASKIHEAVGQLQFAALRGDGQDPERHEKRVLLIVDQGDRVPHFVETDESDVAVWNDLVAALAVKDVWKRRQRLRALRKHIGQRIVEVPSRFQFAAPGPATTMVRVPLNVAKDWYNDHTGWKRTQ